VIVVLIAVLNVFLAYLVYLGFFHAYWIFFAAVVGIGITIFLGALAAYELSKELWRKL